MSVCVRSRAPIETLSNFWISLVGLGAGVQLVCYRDDIIMSMASSNDGTTSRASSKSWACSYVSSSEQTELADEALCRFLGCHMLPSFQLVKSLIDVCAIRSLKSLMLELFALLAYIDVNCGDWRG